MADRVRPGQRAADFGGIDQRTVENRAVAFVYAMADEIVAPGTQFPTSPVGGAKRIGLLAGDHGGLVLSTDDTVFGFPGATFGAPVVANGRSTFRNMRFVSDGSANPLVRLSAAAKCIFDGCTFERRATDVAASWVAIAAGGRAVFNACRFVGTPAAGNVINNAGAALNAGLVGCINSTGLVHVNVTVIFEVT